jgi:hypothetical protein
VTDPISEERLLAELVEEEEVRLDAQDREDIEKQREAKEWG